MSTLRAATVQLEHTSADKERNFAKIEHFTAKAAADNVRLLTFPECCITGYWFLRNLTRQQLEALAEPVPEGPSAQRLLKLAKKHNLTLGAGLVEKAPDGKLHNTYIVALPNGDLHRHRKIQAFEHDDITPGDAYTVFTTPDGLKLGVLICYDNNIIENVRITALMGAQILLAPHQTGGCNSISPHAMKPVDQTIWANRHQNPEAARNELAGDKGRGWLMRWLPSRAHDNGIFLLFSNGIGHDDDEIRTGNAMILDPYGRILTESTSLTDDLVTADLDLNLIELSTGQRWIKSRRPTLYTPLTIPTGKERPTRELRFKK